MDGQTREVRDAQRALEGDEYQQKMLAAAHKYHQTEHNNAVMSLALQAKSGYKAGGGIRANEIKGFLNIWCNQRRLKPEYDFIERGKPPKV